MRDYFWDNLTIDWTFCDCPEYSTSRIHVRGVVMLHFFFVKYLQPFRKMFELMPKSGGHIRPQGPRNSICPPLRKRHCLQ